MSVATLLLSCGNQNLTPRFRGHDSLLASACTAPALHWAGCLKTSWLGGCKCWAMRAGVSGWLKVWLQALKAGKDEEGLGFSSFLPCQCSRVQGAAVALPTAHPRNRGESKVPVSKFQEPMSQILSLRFFLYTQTRIHLCWRLFTTNWPSLTQN